MGYPCSGFGAIRTYITATTFYFARIFPVVEGAYVWIPMRVDFA